MSKENLTSNNKAVDFARLLKEARASAGLNVRELSAATKRNGPGVSITLISMLESGKRTPTYEVATILATALRIDMNRALTAANRSRVNHHAERERSLMKAQKERWANKENSQFHVAG